MRPKRNLFDEIIAGIEAKRTGPAEPGPGPQGEPENLPRLRIDPALVRDTRERLNASVPLFAGRMRVSPRTLKRWEEGRATPNHQAIALMLLIRRDPELFERLRDLDPRG
jgi:putative transcriptional regulator